MKDKYDLGGHDGESQNSVWEVLGREHSAHLKWLGRGDKIWVVMDD